MGGYGARLASKWRVQQSPRGERDVDPAGLRVFSGHPIEETTIEIKVPV